MSDECCNSFGGRITVTIDGVRYPPSEADITIEPGTTTVTGGANHDGSAFFTAKPKLASADVKFRGACGITYTDLLLRCKIDATIVEEDNNRTHLFSGSRITGTPQVNLTSGEVSGLKIEGPSYRFRAG